MSESLRSSLKLITENNPNEVKIVCDTLLRILRSIHEKPNDVALRKVRLESDDVLYNLMPYEGALEALFVIGFEEAYINEIEALLAKINVSKECSKTSPKREESGVPKCGISSRPAVLSNMSNSRFASKLITSYEHVMMYEDTNLKQKALKVIPVDELKNRAKNKFNTYKLTSLPKGDRQDDRRLPPLDFDDFFYLELLAWFKSEFFTWTNQPSCRSCDTNQNMRFIRSDQANSEEISGMAGNVEVYECQTCKCVTRFPRFNHPGKLLETRTGRCGEWANCFCLCSRALGFDTRYVLDWTDHVWCEVYSRSQRRWMHADPCECALDTPLVYEVGWKKKLTYVIAFSRHECVDVTWRYTMNQDDVMKRRNECDEMWLINFTNQLSAKRQEGLDPKQKEELEMRKLVELVEFMSPKKLKEGEDVGRQSGSIEWRLSRGEFHPSTSASPPFRFKLKSEANKKITIRYSTVKNSYQVLTSSLDGSNETESETIRDWHTAAYGYSNIQHKVEHDWQMCYLARTNGAEKAHIEWYFDTAESCARRIELKFEETRFQSGQIRISAVLDTSDDTQLELDLTDRKGDTSGQIVWTHSADQRVFSLDLTSLSIKGVRIRADMWSGSGDTAWQHTQLFRQALKDKDVYLFQVSFYF